MEVLENKKNKVGWVISVKRVGHCNQINARRNIRKSLFWLTDSRIPANHDEEEIASGTALTTEEGA